MFGSLNRLGELPDETRVYCGHEYTQSNGRFALSVDPDNETLAKRMEDIADLRSKRLPTLPTTIGFEKRTNPFMRTGDAAIRNQLGMETSSDVEVFTELRRRKDSF